MKQQMTFTRATKAKARLRAALYGPSGSGKTFTALRIATGLGGPIAVIDTERGSAAKYADRFEFDALELERRSIEDYLAAIDAARAARYAVLIIDSLSHAWQELMDEVDQLANQSKYRGNRWAAWSEGTPRQRALVDAILSFDGHIIATMRAKTEWQTQTSDNGKSKPIRIGLAPEQGKGIEYEFDLLVQIGADHVAEVEKDRTGRYQGKTIVKPGEDFGRELAAWLNSGDAPMPTLQPRPQINAPADPPQRRAETAAIFAPVPAGSAPAAAPAPSTATQTRGVEEVEIPPSATVTRHPGTEWFRFDWLTEGGAHSVRVRGIDFAAGIEARIVSGRVARCVVESREGKLVVVEMLGDADEPAAADPAPADPAPESFDELPFGPEPVPAKPVKRKRAHPDAVGGVA